LKSRSGQFESTTACDAHQLDAHGPSELAPIGLMCNIIGR
jgi:hypothetical protein